MFRRYWSFFRRKQNREILSWLGGGVVVAAGGLWVLVTWLFPDRPPGGPAPSTSQAEAGAGGVAVGRDNSGTITVSPPPAPPAE
ncbi:hypothetical protein [Geminicoccus roseus]|uniref:hypothetical protein n=1 Tax=Geminicoccus roseus TaxID=404900 RepID=UPI000416E6F5|nr:hypothetical protein [Geminicoccus roseus]